MPKISVIIPLYNAEKTIYRTLQSVLAQTIDDLEIIIINDGSTDSSLEETEKISDPRIRVYSFANAGGSVSRNRGFARSTGDFIAFLDADDQWTPDKLEAQMVALQQNPDASVAYSWTEFVDEADHVIVKGQTITVTTREEAYRRLLVQNFLDSGSNPLIRREAVEAVEGFDESLQGCQDTDFYLRLAQHYAFVAVPKYQIRYRFSPNSITSNTKKLEQQGVQFLEKAFATAPPSLHHLKPKSFTHFYRYLMLRSLEGTPTTQRSWEALLYLMRALQYSPNLVRTQTKFLGIMLMKSLIGLVMPSNIAIALLKRRHLHLQR
ncbi:MAG: glycosyltransferase [Symploca sp. SIO2B6]|nr:glycosyltransferase [Symploca sp. SIO2B6]